MRLFPYISFQNSQSILKKFVTNVFSQQISEPIISKRFISLIFHNSYQSKATNIPIHQINYVNWAIYSNKLKPIKFLKDNNNLYRQPFAIYHSFLAQSFSNVHYSNRQHFSSSSNHYFTKKDGIENLHKHKSFAALKSKKRTHRKKSKSIDEDGEQVSKILYMIGSVI